MEDLHLSDTSRQDSAATQPAIYELITQEQIKSTMIQICNEFDVDLERVKVSTTKPGDNLFDQYEIQYKLLRTCESDFEQLQAKIKSFGFDPDTLSIDDLREVARKESIQLDGQLPGFAMTAGDDEIIFFAVSRTNAIEMAQKYAIKEGASKTDFDSVDNAIKYLTNLAQKALFHEVAHIIYARGSFADWDKYIAMSPDIKRLIIAIQGDKYANEQQIPVAEEAFAEFSTEVLSNGSFVGRLGPNDTAAAKIRSLIKKKS